MHGPKRTLAKDIEYIWDRLKDAPLIEAWSEEHELLLKLLRRVKARGENVAAFCGDIRDLMNELPGPPRKS